MSFLIVKLIPSSKIINSDFLNGLDPLDARKKIIEHLEKLNIGKGKTDFRLERLGYITSKILGLSNSNYL